LSLPKYQGDHTRYLKIFYLFLFAYSHFSTKLFNFLFLPHLNHLEVLNFFIKVRLYNHLYFRLFRPKALFWDPYFLKNISIIYHLKFDFTFLKIVHHFQGFKYFLIFNSIKYYYSQLLYIYFSKFRLDYHFEEDNLKWLVVFLMMSVWLHNQVVERKVIFYLLFKILILEGCGIK